MLAFVIGDGSSSINLLELSDLTISTIDLRSVLPDTAHWRSNICDNVIWCPYDPNRLLIATVGFFDATDSNVFTDNRANIYEYNLSSKRARIVTPSSFGKFGSADGFGVYEWLKGSTVNNDSILLTRGVYIFPRDTVVPTPALYNLTFSQSPYTADFLHWVFDDASQSTGKYFLNDQAIPSSVLWYPETFSWSRDRKKLAITLTPTIPSANPNNPSQYLEVWIMDIVRFRSMPSDLNAFYRLNFQDLYCKYSLDGLHAQYATDSTLVVSMHKDGDAVSPLWEITDKGKIVRQLTY